MFNYSKLKGRIVEVYGTQNAFAKALGITPQNLSHKLNNGVGFSQLDILKWCELLKIPIGEIEQYFFCCKSSKN